MPAAEARARAAVLVAHLAFFAVGGTLARLGLQALATYAGAVVTTPAAWANVAGCVVMGLVSADGGRLVRWIVADEAVDGADGAVDGADGADDVDEGAAADAADAAVSAATWWRPRGARSQRTRWRARRRRGAAEREAWTRRQPLYVGLTTGFCGSLTSFSAFARDAFFALANEPPAGSGATTAPTSRSTFYSILALLAVIILTVGLSHAALRLGLEIGSTGLREEGSPPPGPGHRLPTSSHPDLRDPRSTFISIGLTVVIFHLIVPFWLLAIIFAILNPPSLAYIRDGIFAIITSPLGCVLRYVLGRALNARVPSFPLGTFVANMLGVAVCVVVVDLQRVQLPGARSADMVGCAVLQGVEDGFCGCLSTVSTWIAELNILRETRGRRAAWVYGTGTVVAGVGLAVVGMGSVRWGRGWSSSCT